MEANAAATLNGSGLDEKLRYLSQFDPVVAAGSNGQETDE